MTERIDFYCTTPEHLIGDFGDRLTMHEDRWAYCASGATAGHRWQPTGGMTLPVLKRRLADTQRSS